MDEVAKEKLIANLRNINERLNIEINTLKADLGFWKNRHQAACEREDMLKQELQDKNARIRYLTQQLYEHKSEKSKKSNDVAEAKTDSNKKKRGQQRGRPSPKRRDHSHLPEYIETCDLTDSEKYCPICGLPFNEMDATENSEVIETQEVRGYIRKIRRKKYIPGCKCSCNKGIVVAPAPAKLIPRSRYGISIWTHVLIRKYHLQIPVDRILKNLALHGLSIPKGSIGDGIKRIAPLFEPIYQALEERSHQAKWWQADETRWNVFETTKTKSTFRWYLWVFASNESVTYVIDPTRSTDVIESHLGTMVEGILLVDRYAAYKSYTKRNDGIMLAFCWSHVRRDFRDAGLKYKSLHDWAEAWVARINELFHLNNIRKQYPVGSSQFCRSDRELNETANQMKSVLAEQLQQPRLHHAQRKVLNSLSNHWSGLIVFLKNPQIPMDNNGSERNLRTPVVGRKNYYGSVTQWSARFSAVMFSIFETLALWDINALEWLSEYLRACALAGGTAPQDISEYLPWHIRERTEKSWIFSGRRFTESEIETIRALIDQSTDSTRTAIARNACEQFSWYRPDGKLKDASMLKALNMMEAEGLLELPSRRTGIRTIRANPIKHSTRTDPQAAITLPAGQLATDLQIEIADNDESKSLWNEYVDRYHYLGYSPMAGAQLKYMVSSGDQLLALLGFGASAWKIAPRDWFIGWSDEKRQANLHYVVNNARFLILPWVTSKNLASMILARVAGRLADDWQAQYKYRPVVLETFVERERFAATCYRAANWKNVGCTKGRGKKDRFNAANLPIKDIYLYPLQPDFKQIIC